MTAGYEPLRDERRAYVQRLPDAGVAVTADHYDDMAPPFCAFANVFDRSTEAIQRVAEPIQATLAAAPRAR